MCGLYGVVGECWFMFGCDGICCLMCDLLGVGDCVEIFV